MALEIGEEILSADVVEQVATSTLYTNKVNADFGVHSETETHIISMGPSQKATLAFSCFSEAGSANTLSVFYKRPADSEYTHMNTYNIEENSMTVTFTDLLHDFVEFALVIKTSSGIIFSNTSRVTFKRSIMPATAVDGIKIRVLNSDYDAWLDEAATLVTLALYYEGRLGYE